MDGINVKKKLKTKQFKKPDSVTTATICTKSGKLAVPGLCDHAAGGSTVKTEYFAVGTVPKESCDVHVKLNICKESGQAAGPYCPEVISKVFLIKNEEITQTDAYGKAVKRHYNTADTPYVLTKQVQTPCSTHLTPVVPTDSAIGADGEDDGASNDGNDG